MSEIMDLTVVCSSFPSPIIGREIIRESSLDTLERMTRDNELIIVEGEEGIGKTVLLMQFVNKHPHNAFSLWIKPTYRFVDLLKHDLCNQIAWSLTTRELEPSTDCLLTTQIAKLARRAWKEKYYFILDGLQEIPKVEVETRQALIDMLPWGYRGFHFILSGDSNDIRELIPPKTRLKPLPLSRFRLEQTKEYFSDLLEEQKITEDQVYDLHEVCRRLPYRLASAKRLLESGTRPDELQNRSDLYYLEWRKVENSSNRLVLERLLAIIAHGYSTYSITDIAHILNEPTSKLEDLLIGIDFVYCDEKNQHLNFVSESFRRFAADRLNSLKRETQDALIDHFNEEPDSDITLRQLPHIYLQAGRQRELLEYLSSERFLRILQTSQSLFTLQADADLGISAAIELKAEADLLRFAVHKSTLTNLINTDIWRSEIEARVAVQDYKAALVLAESAVLKIDRLRLLSIVARLHQEGGDIVLYVRDQIKRLYSQLELDDYGDKAIEIASDLIFVDPELAIDLVEKATQTDVGEENSLDLALVKLYGNALAAEEAGRLQSTDPLEKIRNHISSPTLQHLTTATTMLVSDYSASKVIQEVELISKASDRIFLLRLWLTANRERQDTMNVVEYAINLIIRETSYSPNARVLREIASPLPYLSDTDELRKLVNKFNSQAEATKAIGPTQDYIRLQLILALAESRYDIRKAYDRVLEVYLYDIDPIEDLAIKTESLARLVATMSELSVSDDFNGELEDIYNDLEKLVAALLVRTADHYYVLQGTIKALAKTHPDRSLGYAYHLNTEERRDTAIFHLVNSIVQLPVRNIDLSFIVKAIGMISDPYLRDEAVLITLAALKSATKDLSNVDPSAISLIQQIDDMRNAVQRCNAYCLAYNYLMDLEPDKYSDLATSILSNLKSSWSQIDIGWNKIDTGFRIVATISDKNREQVRAYLEDTEIFRQTIQLDSLTNANTYLLCLQLAVKAFSGLIPKSIYSQEDLDQLRRFIDYLPASGIKARIWGDVALHFYLQDRFEPFKNIVKQYILPLLDSISEPAQVEETTVNIAPVLYYYHRRSALEQISALPNLARHSAYSNICEFILRKRILTEPYRVQPGQEYGLSYEDIIDICEILENVEIDEVVARYVTRSAESVYRGKSKHHLTRQQAPEVLNRFRRIVNAPGKFPDMRNIKHEGYRIVCLSQLALLDRKFRYEDLINAARAIPNVSDRLFVLGFIASVLPTKHRDVAKSLLQEAYELLEKIPTLIDRANRYESLAIHSQRVDPSLSRRCLQEGLQLLVGNSDFNTFSQQRKFIDWAHLLINEEFAASLASIVDDDPARQRVRQNLRERHQVNRVQRDIANNKYPSEDKEEFKPNFNKAAWRLWEAMNSGQVNWIDQNTCRFLMQVAARMPLEEAYPIIGVVIQSMCSRFANARVEQAKARENLRPIFEAMLRATELAGRIVVRSTEQLGRIKAHHSAMLSTESSTILVNPGDTDQVEQILGEWFENKVETYLKICDPYFGPNDLKMLLILKSIKPNCDVTVLTSQGHHSQVEKPWKEAYRRYWHNDVSTITEPPYTKIVVVGDERKHSPIHDRWWLTDGSGIKIGTSLNSLGATQISEIEFVDSKEASQKEHILDRYLVHYSRTDENGQKLEYEMFTL